MTTIESCAVQCCNQKSNCNVAFVLRQICYHVKCVNDEQCFPLERPQVPDENLKMVLVNPTTMELSWEDLLKNIQTQYKSKDLRVDSNGLDLKWSAYPARLGYNQYPDMNEKDLNDADVDETSYGYPRYSNLDQPFAQYGPDLTPSESKLMANYNGERCIPNGKQCGENEHCIPTDAFGICHCNVGYFRNEFRKCIPDEDILNYEPPADLNDKLMIIKQLNGNREDPVEPSENAETENDPKIGRLSVSAVSKTVQLPDNRAKLAAFPVPDERTSGVAYNYSWSLISQPKGDVNGTMSDKTKSEIELTNLAEGLYRFKVVVTGKGWLGETIANITVIPVKRYNKAPIVIIKPATQIIKEPTNSAILDGSASTVRERNSAGSFKSTFGIIFLFLHRMTTK